MGFEALTKRSVLVSDTLLLSGGWESKYHQVARFDNNQQLATDNFANDMYDGLSGNLLRMAYDRVDNHAAQYFGIHSPDLPALGRWLLDSEPLLKAGLVWYLPNYSTATGRVVDGDVDTASFEQPEQADCIDYLMRDGRAVEASGADPIKSRIVRPILKIDLPFIDGVSLKDFSDITVSEFDSYRGFRNFLRSSFLGLDDAVNAVQSEVELMRIATEIEGNVQQIRAQMTSAKRRRAIAASTAAVGSVGAVLAAVYGPAMEEALKIIGASGGLWGVIDAARNNSPRALKEDRWYYVWALSRKAQLIS
ncbi:hypothetical protein [Streptomyces lydicus]|uniref:hypothetical protein n=1 Tax=Streptomyces lydicus TaxID=47763 RepID=UPI0010133063|nr:hypothetical protein [Streptomyces lydicus]MCZ1011905.1 hypothetical protein [Streptomyces lydicus]